MAEAATASHMAYRPSEDAVTLAARVRRREMSAHEAVVDALDRITALDGYLAAFCTVAPDAIEAADAVDRRLAAGNPVGPLAGVPVAIKDLISTTGLRTTFGSGLYRDNVPTEDDVAVERLRAAGAIVVGKTNTSEFGYGAVGHNPLFPTTRNPWNTGLTPGGSSAGSASAVAAGMIPLALGSDGGGSVRVPAALSGLVGIKPSWGRVPVYPGCRDERDPGASGWESLEHIGPLTRTVADAALALSVLSGPSRRDRHSLPREAIDWTDLDPRPLAGARLSFSHDLGFATVDDEVAEIALSAAETLARAVGGTLRNDRPEIGPTQPTFEGLVALDTDRTGLRRMAREQNYPLTGWLAEIVEAPWTADKFTDAILARKRIANAAWRFMDRYDFLLTPTAACAAFPIDLAGPAELGGVSAPLTAWTAFSALANLTGQPAASVPAGFTADGRPVGLQIIGRRLDDLGVLRAAAALEAAQPWADLWPALLRTV